MSCFFLLKIITFPSGTDLFAVSYSLSLFNFTDSLVLQSKISFFFQAYLIYCLSNAEKFEWLNFMNFETVKLEISFAKSMNMTFFSQAM